MGLSSSSLSSSSLSSSSSSSSSSASSSSMKTSPPNTKTFRINLNWLLFIIVGCISAALLNVIVVSPILCSNLEDVNVFDNATTSAVAGDVSGDGDNNGVATSTATITTSNKNRNNTSSSTSTTSDRVNKLVSKLSQQHAACTDTNITVRCICGTNTHPTYLQNMIETYAWSRYDTSLFEKCLQQNLPLDANTPLDCWPVTYILASFPTSGNELARSILHTLLRRNTFLSEYKEVGQLSHLYTLKAADNTLRIYTSDCDHRDERRRSAPLSIMGKAAIYKTHGPRGPHWGRKVLEKQLTNVPALGGFSTGGIVRLARNPGDQLLRDLFRWDGAGAGAGVGVGIGVEDDNNNNCHKRSHECFLQNAEKYCDEVIDYGSFWADWHEFWMKQSSTTRQIVYYYEHFSNLTRVAQATEKVMDFLNERPPVTEPEPEAEAEYEYEYEYSLREMLSDVVKEPPYEHGTLMTKVCGKEKARALHEATKKVSEQVGYLFNHDSATWSVHAPGVN